MGRLLKIAMALVLLAATGARAQEAWPTGTVKMVVGFAPGGGNDILARIVAEKLRESLGQPFVVENRPGASGVIAIDAVKRSAPDGHTLLVGPSSGMTVNPVVMSSVTYDPLADFAPVGIVGYFPLVVAVHPSLPVTTVSELIAVARARPGEVNYSSAASSFQIATEMFAQMAGIRMQPVAYRGSAPAVNAVLANEVSLTFGDIAAVMPHVRSGRLKALAITAPARSKSLPDLPTVQESGLPGYEMVLWSGLFAPAGTPPAIIAKLNAEVNRIVALPDVQEKFANLGVEPGGGSPAALTETIRADLARFRKVAADAGIKAE